MTGDAFDRLAGLELSQRRDISAALEQIPNRADPFFRELALLRTSSLLDEARLLAAGEIVFSNTETWRAAYERLLSESDVTTYLSVAWVRTSDYWCDNAGRRSLRLNYELLDRGMEIERMLILPPNLWRNDEPVPCAVVSIWMEEQYYRGIKLSLVRESELKTERDLISDFGIYGERAVGEHETDEFSRTIRFRLSFADSSIRRARERWNRLSIFAVPCEQLIDLR